jgi:hypothetical protein
LIAKIPTHSTGLRPDQTSEIARVRELRKEATDLRARISAGFYNDQDVRRLWKIAEVASSTLHIANPELAERAGLGANFFTTLVRDKRRPKFQNFLRALTVLIEVANERLAHVERDQGADSDTTVPGKITQRIKQDRESLLHLATTLSQLALDEMGKLDAERPNHPDKIASYDRQRELLRIFADGFARIARALSATDAEPVRLKKAAKVIEAVGDGFNRWWNENGDEVIDWSVRLPVLTASVAALGWAGAPMLLGTSIVAALVGGEKVMKVISKRSAKGSRK